MKLNFDVVVIGSGPSGIAASIYLKRANKNVAMIDCNAPGGQVNRISLIENYPGFSKVTGPDLAYNMFMQTQELGVSYKYGKVIEVIDEGDYKIVKLLNEEITCQAVILASGRKPKELELPNEKGLIGRGISWCAICDGALFKGMPVIIAGDNNNALEESLYMADIASLVTIVSSNSKLSADQIYQDKIARINNIVIKYNYNITKLNILETKLSSVEVTNNLNKEQETIDSLGLFVYLGYEPSTDYLKSLNLNSEDEYLVVDDNMMTNIDKIYACGDIIKKKLYQITTAVAEGSKAAMSAINDLNDKN